MVEGTELELTMATTVGNTQEKGIRELWDL